MIGEVATYQPGSLNVVIKDLLDIEGSVTSCGSRLVAHRAQPALRDSSAVARLRASGAHVRGKANLVEFAFGTHGVNPWFGTPTNPCSSDLIPGGSSSGSAVAVALGEAEVGVGTDTGGSVRIPAACCGVFGLKPTHGVIDDQGCAPLAPSLDTIGVLANNLGDLAAGFRGIGGVLEGQQATWIAQVPSGDSRFDAVVGEIVARIDLSVETLPGSGIDRLFHDGTTVLLYEALMQLGGYLDEAHRLDPRGVTRLRSASEISADSYRGACERRAVARDEWLALLDMGEGILALPTIAGGVPHRGAFDVGSLNRLTLPFNYLGFPALTIPVNAGPPGLQGQGSGGQVPFALQLVAVDRREAQLLEVAAEIGAVVGSRGR